MARDQGAYSMSRRSFCGTLAAVLVAPGIAIAQAARARRRRTIVRQLVVALSLVFALGMADIAFSLPSDLDPDFGAGGIAILSQFGAIPGVPTTPPTLFFRPGLVAIAVQPDGKSVLGVGVDRCVPPMPLSASCSLAYSALLRYNPDGSVDAGFGTNGIVTILATPSDFGILALLVQTDGKILMETESHPGYMDNGLKLLRFDSSGAPDAQFGNAGTVIVEQVEPVFPSVARALLQQSDGKLLVGVMPTVPFGSPPSIGVIRLNLDGSLDPTYGSSGIALLSIAAGASLTTASLQSDGKLVLAGTFDYGQTGYPIGVFVARLNANGTPDDTFGASNGVVLTSFTIAATNKFSVAVPLGVTQHAGGKLLVAGTLQTLPEQGLQLALLQLNADGTLDSTFGTLSRIVAPAGSITSVAAAAGPGDGYTVFAGWGRDTVVSRLAPDGSPDPGFGDCGAKDFANTAPGLVRALGVQSDGKVLVGLSLPTLDQVNQFGQPGLARLLGGHSTTVILTDRGPNPSRIGDSIVLDASIVGTSPTIVGPAPVSGSVAFMDAGVPIPGCTVVPIVASGAPGNTGSGNSALCQVANLGVGSHTFTAIYSGDPENPSAPSCHVVHFVDSPGSATAVEYYHDVFDDYFVTIFPDEVAALDNGYLRGWRRTGMTFRVHPLDQMAGSSSVCRFFSGQSFAPKSSHFLTPVAAECAIVQQNPGWLYEGTAFGLDLPSPDGNCNPSQAPLYRIYNDGQGAAPSHRYLTDLGVRDSMIFNDGWIPEGFGAGVIGCVQ